MYVRSTLPPPRGKGGQNTEVPAHEYRNALHSMNVKWSRPKVVGANSAVSFCLRVRGFSQAKFLTPHRRFVNEVARCSAVLPILSLPFSSLCKAGCYLSDTHGNNWHVSRILLVAGRVSPPAAAHSHRSHRRSAPAVPLLHGFCQNDAMVSVLAQHGHDWLCCTRYYLDRIASNPSRSSK